METSVNLGFRVYLIDEEVVRSVVRSRSSKKRGTQYLISLGGYNDYEYGIQKEKYTQVTAMTFRAS